MKLVLFADPHLAETPVGGRDGAACLAAALLHAAAAHPDAARAVILGDLTDDGGEAGYRRLAGLVAAAPWPVDLLMGNHDDRAAFRAVFGGGAADTPVEGTVMAGAVPCHLLDTLVPGRTAGRLGPGGLAFLDAALARAAAPGLVFLHHPPIATATPAFATHGLDDREALAALLARHPGKVRALFFGHCHMPVAGLVAGVPAFGLPSTTIQSEPVFDRPAFRSDRAAPGGYGVLLAGEAEFAFHLVTLTGGGHGAG